VKAALVCLGVFQGAIGARLPSADFTLAWTHSIEKVRWEEDWRAVDGRLVAIEARVQGGGAGMEPPPDARLTADGWFHYVPKLAPQSHLSLSRRGFAKDYELCWDGTCRAMGSVIAPGPDEVTDIFACPPAD